MVWTVYDKVGVCNYKRVEIGEPVGAGGGGVDMIWVKE